MIFSKRLKTEGGNLCIAGTAFDIADAENFLNKCERIKIRHAVYKWKECKKFSLRFYKSLNSSSYDEINAELTADYIIVSPQLNSNEEGVSTERTIGNHPSERSQQGEQNREQGEEGSKVEPITHGPPAP